MPTIRLGRLIDSIEKADELNNTLIFYTSSGTMGPSAEGGLEGNVSVRSPALVGVQSWTIRHRQSDRTRSVIRSPNRTFPVGWAWAMATPLQWTKQVASHFGGTRNPMVVHWPNGIRAQG